MVKPYLYIGKMQLQKMMAYRFNLLSGIAIQFLIMVSTSYFWISAYSGTEISAGVTKEQMLTYTIISAMLSSVFTCNVESRISNSVYRGGISMDLMKPVNLFGMYLAEDLGNVVVSFIQSALPILIVGTLLIQVPAPASAPHFLLFFVSAALSYAINWLFAAVFGMWSFKLISMKSLSAIKANLIRLLSGSIIPLWFFPGWFQNILGFFPFMYIYQLPLSIYIGQISGVQIAEQMGIQIFWAAFFGLLFYVIQKKSVANVLVQGG